MHRKFYVYKYLYKSMSKIITIRDELYEKLKEMKEQNESFSKVIAKSIENKSNKDKVMSLFGKRKDLEIDLKNKERMEMVQVCLDTSIIIEFIKGNQNIVAIIDKFYISAIVVYEYGRGKLTIEEVKEYLKDFNFISLDIIIVLKAIEIYKSLIKRGKMIMIS